MHGTIYEDILARATRLRAAVPQHRGDINNFKHSTCSEALLSEPFGESTMALRLGGRQYRALAPAQDAKALAIALVASRLLAARKPSGRRTKCHRNTPQPKARIPPHAQHHLQEPHMSQNSRCEPLNITALQEPSTNVEIIAIGDDPSPSQERTRAQTNAWSQERSRHAAAKPTRFAGPARSTDERHAALRAWRVQQGTTSAPRQRRAPGPRTKPEHVGPQGCTQDLLHPIAPRSKRPPLPKCARGGPGKRQGGKELSCHCRRPVGAPAASPIAGHAARPQGARRRTPPQPRAWLCLGGCGACHVAGTAGDARRPGGGCQAGGGDWRGGGGCRKRPTAGRQSARDKGGGALQTSGGGLA